MNAVADLLEQRRAELDAVSPVPFLHDTTTKNVIIGQDGNFSGIVDVDDLCYGDPRLTPALTLASLMAWGGSPEYVRAWMRIAGYRVDRLFHFYVALCLMDFLSEVGTPSNGNEIDATVATRRQLVRAFEGALSEARKA